MQDRRHFLKTGFSVATAGLAGAAALTRARRSVAEEAPPETTSVRLASYVLTCTAPLLILDDLLREEGFIDIRYASPPVISESTARGEVDFGQDFSSDIIVPIDTGAPIVMLSGVHLGCIELFANESIRSVADLKGKRVAVSGTEVWDPPRLIISLFAAGVGLDPAKDINWVVTDPSGADDAALLTAGEIDAVIEVPPVAQEFRARNIGHVILSTALHHPWSEYFCCMLVGNADFVRRNPIATKRVVRAMLRATDICAAKPDWVAQRLVDRGFAHRYDYTRQGLGDVSYRAWRDYDVEDSVRFYALRLREIGMIKSSPDKIIATGTDWRFIKEVRKEYGL
jgi:NitT/TauT family transport system substrate-binding protein